MKILSSSQIRELDAFTIANEPVTSWCLMERASRAFVQWLLCKFDEEHQYHIFCGKGNNGGDGLAIARMLSGKGYAVKVYVTEHRSEGSPDFEENLRKLHGYADVILIDDAGDVPAPDSGIIIDAVLGSGLNKPAEGLPASVIKKMNGSGLTIVSVDIASGLFADKPNQPGDDIVMPDFTVSFQVPKPSFLIPECGPFVGEWHVVDIGLSPVMLDALESEWFLTTRENLPHLLKKRGKFSHKGTYGHALMIAGSYGKMGAAMLASKACLRSGVGLLTSYIPSCGYTIMQTGVPEAMVVTDPGDHFLTSIPDLEGYAAIAIGPGMGTDPQTLDAFQKILSLASCPLVLDADALNLLAQEPGLLALLPENTILTPHPKEFSRLGGEFGNGFEVIAGAREFSEKHRVIVCLKGAHTAVALPDKTVYFNATGNPGMATGGSGDVLTGIILALLAQGYAQDVAARLAVFVHGEAGDRAAAVRSQAALIASDLIENLRW